jgi:hypothetical protein
MIEIEENYPQMTQMDTDRKNSRGINRRGRRGPQRGIENKFLLVFSAALCVLCG